MEPERWQRGGTGTPACVYLLVQIVMRMNALAPKNVAPTCSSKVRGFWAGRGDEPRT